MKLGLVVFSILTFLILWTSIRNHFTNWDGIAYAALAISSDKIDPKITHETTFRLLKNSVSADKFKKLTSSGIQQKWSTDVDHFMNQLTLYKVKYVYYLLLRLLWLLGINPFIAMTVISLVGSIATCFCVLIWMQSEWKHWTASLVSFLICYLSGVYEVVRYWSPDAIASFVSTFSMFLVVRKKFIPGMLLMILMIWIRPDMIFLLVAWVVFLTIFAPPDFRLFKSQSAILILAVATSSIVMLSSFSDYPGWRSIFHYKFINFIYDPKVFVPKFGFNDYLGIVFEQSARAFRNVSPVFVAIFVSLVAYFTPVPAGARTRFYRYLIASTGIALFIKFVSFPDPEFRLYISSFCVIGVSFFAIYWRAIATAHRVAAKSNEVDSKWVERREIPRIVVRIERFARALLAPFRNH